jgi:hypothetical protein
MCVVSAITCSVQLRFLWTLRFNWLGIEPECQLQLEAECVGVSAAQVTCISEQQNRSIVRRLRTILVWFYNSDNLGPFEQFLQSS